MCPSAREVRARSTNALICKCNSQINVSHFAKLLLAVGATLCFLGRLHATGYYGPDFYLDDGGKNVDGSPEFYWGLEVRRLAKEFHPTEKRVVSEKAEHKSDEEASDNSDLSDATEDRSEEHTSELQSHS